MGAERWDSHLLGRTLGRAGESQQRDTWHVSHLGWQVQGRVDRILHKLQEHLPTGNLQADRIAQGKKALGANPRTDVQAHQAQIRREIFLVVMCRRHSTSLQKK